MQRQCLQCGQAWDHIEGEREKYRCPRRTCRSIMWNKNRLAPKYGGREGVIPEPWIGPDLVDDHGPYRLIKLTKGHFAKIDVADFDWINTWKWCVTGKKDDPPYASRGQRDKETKKNKTIIMARLIMGFPDGKKIDHQDHDTLNNRRYNLRVASNSENGRNARKLKSDTSSKFKGVDWHKQKNKWRARILINRKSVYLGSFESEQDAANAYAEASRSVHGEFGYFTLNE